MLDKCFKCLAITGQHDDLKYYVKRVNLVFHSCLLFSYFFSFTIIPFYFLE